MLAISERDNVELLVLPTAIGAHDGLVGEFTLLNFAGINGHREAPGGVA